MNATLTNKPPIWFWIVSIIALIWNGLGVNGYLSQAYNTESYRNSYTPEQLEIAASLPSWTMGAFAIAVFSALIGAICLLLRKKIAYSLFLISLLAVIAQMGYSLTKGYTDNIAMTISIIVFAIFLVWFSKTSKSKGWIA
ncbi:hypothetical protein [Thalassobellus citreus]|uniref:hypothetical protein n=1 Tax=Thalassobellus citreus TaxID=3367752 RepID=UPI0037B2FA6F